MFDDVRNEKYIIQYSEKALLLLLVESDYQGNCTPIPDVSRSVSILKMNTSEHILLSLNFNKNIVTLTRHFGCGESGVCV